MKYQAVLFDLDGTLIDSVPDLAFAIDAMLMEFGLPAAGREKVQSWVGNGARKLVERALTFSYASNDAAARVTIDEGHQSFLRHYAGCCSKHSRLYPHVVSVLQQLHQQGIKMALVTNKPVNFTYEILAQFQLDSFFDVIIGGECLVTRKPDPLMLEEAVRRLGFESDHSACLMVGDSANDIDAAKQAFAGVGLDSVCVDYGYHHDQPPESLGATQIISSFDQLLAI